MPSLIFVISSEAQRSREIYCTIVRLADSSIRLCLTRNDIKFYNIYCNSAIAPIPGNPKNPAMATVT